MQVIYEGTRARVLDHENGTVSKITTDVTEYNIARQLEGVELQYVANYLEIHVCGLCKVPQYTFKKEKIDNWDLLEYTMKHLGEHWDDALLSGYELYEYLNEYLKSDRDRAFLSYRTPGKFKEYLLSTSNKEYTPIFDQLCDIVQELKDHSIFNIDWNSENFGYKNNHLALFELGGAKIKNNGNNKRSNTN